MTIPIRSTRTWPFRDTSLVKRTHFARSLQANSYNPKSDVEKLEIKNCTKKAPSERQWRGLKKTESNFCQRTRNGAHCHSGATDGDIGSDRISLQIFTNFFEKSIISNENMSVCNHKNKIFYVFKKFLIFCYEILSLRYASFQNDRKSVCAITDKISICSFLAVGEAFQNFFFC